MSDTVDAMQLSDAVDTMQLSDAVDAMQLSDAVSDAIRGVVAVRGVGQLKVVFCSTKEWCAIGGGLKIPRRKLLPCSEAVVPVRGGGLFLYWKMYTNRFPKIIP